MTLTKLTFHFRNLCNLRQVKKQLTFGTPAHYSLENRNNKKMFKLTHTIWKVLTDFLTHYALEA